MFPVEIWFGQAYKVLVNIGHLIFNASCWNLIGQAYKVLVNIGHLIFNAFC